MPDLFVLSGVRWCQLVTLLVMPWVVAPVGILRFCTTSATATAVAQTAYSFCRATAEKFNPLGNVWQVCQVLYIVYMVMCFVAAGK
jgi:hypothetical protein